MIAALWSIIRIAAKRLLAERGLALAMTFGLTAAVALTMSVPLYADAVYFRVFRENVLGAAAQLPDTPLSFRFRYVGARDGARQWEEVQPLDAYLNGPAVRALGLAPLSFTHHFKTDIFRLYYADADPNAAQGLTWISFATLNEMERHVQLQAGRFPEATNPASDVVETLVHADAAAQFSLMPGDVYLARHGDAQFKIRVAGVWTPADPWDKFWSPPLEELALVTEEMFAGRIAPALPDEVYSGLWLVTVDGSRLHASDIATLSRRIATVQEQAGARLPHVTLDDSPLKALQEYRRDTPVLTFLLFAFSVPIIGLLLVFIGLVTGLYVTRRQNEIAVLRSRGATKAQVVGITALEGMILGLLSLLFGSPLGMGLAWLIGRARSFLNFDAPVGLRVGLTPPAVAAGAAAAIVALVAQLLPTAGVAVHTIVTYKQERARVLRPPWWQRAWLDFLLLLPTGYGFYVLQKQGSLAAEGGRAVTDIFRDPLLFLTPTLGLFALALVIARILPIAMTAVAWAASRTRSVGLLLASRQLSRAPAIFTAPLVLLVITLSLSAFTASLAQTLDAHLSKQMFYRAGADLNLAETGVSARDAAGGGPGAGFRPAAPPPDAEVVVGGPEWILRPVEAHLELPGVEAAARVGRYQAFVDVSPTPITGVFIGIDRLDFPRVAYWQRNFAAQPLGALMNTLARAPDGVLVSRDFLTAQGSTLQVGDYINLIVRAYDESTSLNLQILGVVDLFPTWYPEDGPLFVGNLDHFFEQAGYRYPYNVWLKTAPDADYHRIVAAVRGMTAFLDPLVDPAQVVRDGLDIVVTEWRSGPLDVLEEQRRPQRQGLFGLLSVGFIAAALLTVIGFLLYALFTFRRRFVELGVLRAVGLSKGQMTVLLACELAALILIGMGAGSALGVWVSKQFIPYLQVGVEAAARFPPFVVLIAWPSILRIYALFGVLFIAALGGLTVLLLRMKVFQAVKLGETV